MGGIGRIVGLAALAGCPGGATGGEQIVSVTVPATLQGAYVEDFPLQVHAVAREADGDHAFGNPSLICLPDTDDTVVTFSETHDGPCDLPIGGFLVVLAAAPEDGGCTPKPVADLTALDPPVEADWVPGPDDACVDGSFHLDVTLGE